MLRQRMDHACAVPFEQQSSANGRPHVVLRPSWLYRLNATVFVVVPLIGLWMMGVYTRLLPTLICLGFAAATLAVIVSPRLEMNESGLCIARFRWRGKQLRIRDITQVASVSGLMPTHHPVVRTSTDYLNLYFLIADRKDRRNGVVIREHIRRIKELEGNVEK